MIYDRGGYTEYVVQDLRCFMIEKRKKEKKNLFAFWKQLVRLEGCVMYGQDPWLVIRISDGLRSVGETGVSSIILDALHPLLTQLRAGHENRVRPAF